jgi:hypothetical protein
MAYVTGAIPTLSFYTYIASLLHSYSINSVLHLLPPTIRDSMAHHKIKRLCLTLLERSELTVYPKSFALFHHHRIAQSDPRAEKVAAKLLDILPSINSVFVPCWEQTHRVVFISSGFRHYSWPRRSPMGFLP